MLSFSTFLSVTSLIGALIVYQVTGTLDGPWGEAFAINFGAWGLLALVIVAVRSGALVFWCLWSALTSILEG